MKKLLALLLVLLCLTACGEEAEPTPVPEGYLPLEDALAGSEICCTEVEGGILLEEDGLSVGLTTVDHFVYRETYRTGSMERPLLWTEDGIYLPVDFYENYLLAGEETPSLYHGAKFFPWECWEALQDPEQRGNKKLLAQVELPRSMEIEIPNLDKSRIFYPTPVNGNQAAELKKWGDADGEDRTVGEYEVIRGSLTLAEAEIPCQDYKDANPEADWENMKVRDYLAWQTQYRRQVQKDHLSSRAVHYLEDMGIELSDLHCLRQWSGEKFTFLDEETAREKIREDYQRTLDGLAEWAGRSSQNPAGFPDWWPDLDQFDHVYNYGVCLATAKDGLRQDFYPDGTVQADGLQIEAVYFGKYQVQKYYKMAQRPTYGLLDMEGNVLVPPDYDWTRAELPAKYVGADYLPEEACFLARTAEGTTERIPLAEILIPIA